MQCTAKEYGLLFQNHWQWCCPITIVLDRLVEPCASAFVIAITLNGGCRDSSNSTGTGALAPVSGKVTFADGQPFPGGYVVFRMRGTQKVAHGPIQKNGTFEMSTAGTKGASIGEHQVIVLSPQNDPFVPQAINVQTKDSDPPTSLPAMTPLNSNLKLRRIQPRIDLILL